MVLTGAVRLMIKLNRRMPSVRVSTLQLPKPVVLHELIVV